MAQNHSSPHDAYKGKLKKPMQKAVAISYNPEEEGAPTVVAKGKGIIAQSIIQRATDTRVRTYQDKALVEELEQIEMGLQIPPELYHAVAGVLLFISDLEKKNVR